MRIRLLLTFAIAGLGTACGTATAPRASDVPLETARLQFLPCGWEPRAPALPRLAVDLRLNSGNENRVPTTADVQAVQSAGGRVLYQFRVAVVRAVLDTAAVRRLVAGPGAVAEYATAVTDTADYGVETQVFYTRAVTAADVQAIVDAGGTSVAGLLPLGVVYATLSDAVIARVAQLPGVAFVRARDVGCATAASARPATR